MGVAATAGIAMSMQSAMVKQQISIQMVKMQQKQDQAVVQMLAQSVNAYRGNVVNTTA